MGESQREKSEREDKSKGRNFYLFKREKKEKEEK